MLVNHIGGHMKVLKTWDSIVRIEHMAGVCTEY